MAREMIINHNAGLDTPRGLGFALGPEAFGKGCSRETFGHGGATGTFAWADPNRDIVCVILTSLPSGISKPLILKPVSDVISST
jgi:CubicO group peptidase (beta-lactamase class C family)